MPSILDRILGRKPAEKTAAEAAKVTEEAAAKRREELAAKQKAAEDARKAFEAAEAARVAAQKAAQTTTGAAGTIGAAASAAAAVLTGKEYVVVSGDSLSKIAKEQLGDAKRWPEIYEANKAVIGDNPNLIKPGQKLRLP